jgi:urea transporter
VRSSVPQARRRARRVQTSLRGAATVIGGEKDAAPGLEQVVGTLVGSIGLIAAVPVATVLAALLARDGRERALREAHAHPH